jgi:hypothetical protein
MAVTNGCSCGCSEMTTITEAKEACGCGCACCGEATRTAEEEIAELNNLRQAIDKRLAELEPETASS